ncbi:unnamed protein product [Peronospora belbahrii]|uniref:RWP-RK domain-containing protein n=1 Tax=Peronospora belbahrii TaxID=622444 RepID=A0AAU9L1Q9_9STRA|nr:unnamed protein product [Peronospora belbahrii]
MSTFSTVRLPHILTTESFQMHSQQYPCQGFGGMPHAANYSTSAMIPSQERMALPPLNTLPSRAFTSSKCSKSVVSSPAATLSHQPAQSPSKKRPLAEAASIFGICMTLMKKICRKNGVPRWPHRQIRGLRKSIWSIEKALRCCESEAQRNSYNDHLQKQRMKLMTILKGPTCPSSKAAFELVLSEPCSPISELATPIAAEKTRGVQTSPVVNFSAASPVFLLPTAYSQTPQNLYSAQQSETSNKSPKLPAIASLLIKNEEQRTIFSYKL